MISSDRNVQWLADMAAEPGIGVLIERDSCGTIIGAVHPVPWCEAIAIGSAWRRGVSPPNVVRDPQGELGELLQRVQLDPRWSVVSHR